MRMRRSSLVLCFVLLAMGFALLVLKGDLQVAHEDESIHYVASDAGIYYTLYELLYADTPIADSPTLFLVGSPILLIKLASGNLLLVQAFNLLVMALTLLTALRCLPTARQRLAFLGAALAFPYFLFGFLSLNKEIYAMCAAIFYACYMIRGRLSHLAFALLLAAFARYYLLLALLVLPIFVPRNGPTRWRLALALLVAISVAAPIAKELVPGYSSEDVTEVAGVTGRLFAQATDSFGYMLVYPIKYVVLIPTKAYGLLIGSDRAGDAMEAVVSLVSLIAFVAACRILLRKGRQRAQPIVRRLVFAGLVAPMPIMWSEIMHWRYYSFVYFFFVFAVVLDRRWRGLRPSVDERLTAAHA